MAEFTAERLAARASTRRVPELDGLRAIAILLVIGCHYPAFSSTLHYLPEYGWVGVELFFVLSGFLITSILLPLKGTPRPYIPFLERRAARIMPPYFLVLALVAAAYWVVDREQMAHARSILARHLLFASSLHGTSQYLERTWQVLAGTARALPLFARRPLQPNFAGVTSFDFGTAVGHFWSVSVEEWYYVLWAPVVLVLRRSGIATVGVVMIALAFLIRWLGFNDWEWYVNFVCRWDMLAVGGLLALWMEQRLILGHEAQRRGDRVLRYVSSGAAICLSLLLIRLWPFLGKDIRGSVSFAAFGPLLLALAVAGVVAVLLNGSLSQQPLCRFMRWTPMVYVGRRSYMIYLVHIPAYIFLARLFRLGPDTPGIRAWLLALASSGVSLGVAALSWRFFESPILAFRDRQAKRTPTPDPSVQVATKP